MNNVVPGAVLYPGRNAWYAQGVVAWLQAIIWHYTVGVNSLGLIANNGLCAFLIARDGTIYQTAPWDSVNSTQCEWNRIVQGIEVESLDGSITAQQIASLGYLTLFLCNVGSIPLGFYDGPRLRIGDSYNGVTNHRNLVHQACAQHSDGFGVDVWNAAMAINQAPGTQPVTPRRKVIKMWVGYVIWQGTVICYLLNDQGKLVKEFAQVDHSPYGFPNAALNDNLPRIPLTGAEWSNVINHGQVLVAA